MFLCPQLAVCGVVLFSSEHSSDSDVNLVTIIIELMHHLNDHGENVEINDFKFFVLVYRTNQCIECLKYNIFFLTIQLIFMANMVKKINFSKSVNCPSIHPFVWYYHRSEEICAYKLDFATCSLFPRE